MELLVFLLDIEWLAYYGSTAVPANKSNLRAVNVDGEEGTTTLPYVPRTIT